MNELMMHLYSSLWCIAIHPKYLIMWWGGGGGAACTWSVMCTYTSRLVRGANVSTQESSVATTDSEFTFYA